MATSRDSRDRPAYSMAEATEFLRLSPRAIKEWTSGPAAREGNARKASSPVIEPAERHRGRLSFNNLVELFVLGDLRSRHRVPLQRVRGALKHLESTLNAAHPLLRADFQGPVLDEFIEQLAGDERERLGADDGVADPPAIRRALETRLGRVKWDDSRLASRIYPIVKPCDGPHARTIAIDPRVCAGRPTIAGTSITTRVIAERFRAGESLQALAEDYELECEFIDDALRCELRWDDAA